MRLFNYLVAAQTCDGTFLMPRLASSAFRADRGGMFASGSRCDRTTPGPRARNHFINLLTFEK